MNMDILCVCGHNENSHSDSGCQFTDCRCDVWRKFPSEKQDKDIKKDADSPTQKLAGKLGQMVQHKSQLKKDSEVLKKQKLSLNQQLSKSDKWDGTEVNWDIIEKLENKRKWDNIDKEIEKILETDFENISAWIKKGHNNINLNKDDEAIHCFKNALMLDSKQDNKFDKKNYQILNSLGSIYYTKKDYTTAMNFCKASLKIKEDYIPALKQLGYIYRDLPDYELSKEQWNKILNIKKEDVDALDNLGYICERSNKWDESIKYYDKSKQVKDNDDDDIYSDIRAAWCYYKKEDFEHAELLINKERIRKNENQQSLKIRGTICMASKKYNEAIENFEKEFNWISVRGDIWFDLAYCNQEIDNTILSLEYYQKYIEISGLSSSTSQNMGVAYEKLGKPKEAIKWYDKGLEKYPQDFFILKNKAFSCRILKQYDESIKCYDAILEKKPHDLWILNHKASILCDMGKYPESLDLYEIIRSTDSKEDSPPEDLILNNIGWTWIQSGDYEKGLDFVEQALKIDSTKAFIIDSKAVALKNLGRFKEAKEWYEKKFEITKNEEDKMEIGICQRRMGLGSDEDLKHGSSIEAIKIFDSILEKNKSNREVWYNKSLCYWNLNKYDDAKKNLQEAIKINSNIKKYWFELAEIANIEEKYQQSILFFDKSIEIAPTLEDYLGKANALYELENYEEAESCYDDAISIYDGTELYQYRNKIKIIAQVWNNKGNSLFDQKKNSEAIDCYDKSIEIAPKYEVPVAHKGNALRFMKKYDDAIKCLNDALELDPKYYWAQNELILAYKDWKKYDDAIKIAEQTLKQYPDKDEKTTKILVEIYEELGDTSKQKEYEEKLQKLKDLK